MNQALLGRIQTPKNVAYETNLQFLSSLRMIKLRSGNMFSVPITVANSGFVLGMRRHARVGRVVTLNERRFGGCDFQGGKRRSAGVWLSLQLIGCPLFNLNSGVITCCVLLILKIIQIILS